MDHLTMQRLAERFVAWAEGCDDIRAAFVVGSSAREDHPADAWSDLDLMLAVNDPNLWLERTAWLEAIGPILISTLSRTAGGEWERLALFQGGHNVDFVFVPVDSLRGAAEAGFIPDTFRRGSRVLVDKDGWAARLVPERFERLTREPCSAAEFGEMVTRFWYAAYYVAKQLRRGDLWLVKVCDGYTKELLLRMIEEHALATRGRPDVWHMGRFMPEWADPRAVEALHDAFGRYDAADSWRALLATMDLYRRLARETGAAMGYSYPSGADEAVTGLVRELYAGIEQ